MAVQEMNKEIVCLRAEEIATVKQEVKDFREWQTRQNGSLQGMENSIKLLALSSEAKFKDIDKSLARLPWWLIGIEGTVIGALIVQLILRGTP